ncbi:MAG: hypothetical protein QOC91_115, partial [Solirubrobacteraceae bacterium]|nr:hypothetical protein [Solirubrobacteraceae bacterium]
MQPVSAYLGAAEQRELCPGREAEHSLYPNIAATHVLQR